MSMVSDLTLATSLVYHSVCTGCGACVPDNLCNSKLRRFHPKNLVRLPVRMVWNLCNFCLRLLPCFQILSICVSVVPRLSYGHCSHLLAPVSMTTCHTDRHLPQVRHLLSLEPIQVGLYRRARIFEVLCGQVERVLQLSRGVSVNFACQSRSPSRT